MRYIKCFTPIILFFMTAALPAFSSTEKPDHRRYNTLLEKYVVNGKVNYQGLASEESRLDAYLDHLAAIDPDRLDRNDQFAFYINAYNAWTLKLILEHSPGIRSIKDAGGIFSSPWKKKLARINGEVVTLDHIEHDILRPKFRDPRVHFAINCAARSCPPLAGFAFSGDKLNQQLDRQTRAFINAPQSNFIEGDTLWVSRIFKWFGEDFDHQIVAFFLIYADGDFKRKLETNKKNIKVEYLDYDWSLNGKERINR